jgi:sensor domain CHASE-containing protein
MSEGQAMSEQGSIVAIICGVAIVVSVLIVLSVHLHYLLRARALHLTWEQERLRDQQFWEVQQEKHICELETGFKTQIQQLQGTWRHWESQDAAIVAAQIQQYEQEIARMNLEYEVLRLPRTEDVPLS